MFKIIIKYVIIFLFADSMLLALQIPNREIHDYRNPLINIEISNSDLYNNQIRFSLRAFNFEGVKKGVWRNALEFDFGLRNLGLKSYDYKYRFEFLEIHGPTNDVLLDYKDQKGGGDYLFRHYAA